MRLNLSEEPITEDWLKENWEIDHELERGNTFCFDELATPHNDWTHRTALVLVSLNRLRNKVLVYALGHWVVMNQGQFTAFMYSIGRHPKGT